MALDIESQGAHLVKLQEQTDNEAQQNAAFQHEADMRINAVGARAKDLEAGAKAMESRMDSMKDEIQIGSDQVVYKRKLEVGEAEADTDLELTLTDVLHDARDKVAWDATVTVSKAEEFQVEYLCQRVKKTGSGAGKERLSHSSCEKIQAGLIDLREQQIADDLLEEKFNRNEKGNDIKTANSIRALKLVKMRVKEEEQSFDLSSKIWKQVG